MFTERPGADCSSFTVWDRKPWKEIPPGMGSGACRGSPLQRLQSTTHQVSSSLEVLWILELRHSGAAGSPGAITS